MNISCCSASDRDPCHTNCICCEAEGPGPGCGPRAGTDLPRPHLTPQSRGSLDLPSEQPAARSPASCWVGGGGRGPARPRAQRRSLRGCSCCTAQGAQSWSRLHPSGATQWLPCFPAPGRQAEPRSVRAAGADADALSREACSMLRAQGPGGARKGHFSGPPGAPPLSLPLGAAPTALRTLSPAASLLGGGGGPALGQALPRAPGTERKDEGEGAAGDAPSTHPRLCHGLLELVVDPGDDVGVEPRQGEQGGRGGRGAECVHLPGRLRPDAEGLVEEAMSFCRESGVTRPGCGAPGTPAGRVWRTDASYKGLQPSPPACPSLVLPGLKGRPRGGGLVWEGSLWGERPSCPAARQPQFRVPCTRSGLQS